MRLKLTTLLRVVLPLARPALATVAVVAFVNIWNEFFFANLQLVSQDNQNVQLALAGFRSQFGFNVTGAVAGATLVMLVPIGLFLILQRQVIAGLTAGAVKRPAGPIRSRRDGRRAAVRRRDQRRTGADALGAGLPQPELRGWPSPSTPALDLPDQQEVRTKCGLRKLRSTS